MLYESLDKDILCGYYDVGVKRYFAPDDDTQHAHYMCNVLLKHLNLSSFFIKNDCGISVLRVIKS